MYEGKIILDVCCGPRGFWFDKANQNALYVDQRKLESFTTGEGKDKRTRSVVPDQIQDFRCLTFEDASFKMVVFDPPHLFLGENSYMAKIYGSLNRNTWKQDIKRGFKECFRVLENGGTLVFKWNETDVPLKEILELCDYNPLLGHPSGKLSKTHWVIFMKLDNQKKIVQ